MQFEIEESFKIKIELMIDRDLRELFGSGKNPNLTILSAKLHMKDELITRISGWSFLLSSGSLIYRLI